MSIRLTKYVWEQILDNSVTVYFKVNQMRSPDLEFCPKTQIFDLDRFRAAESKKIRSSNGKQSKFETL